MPPMPPCVLPLASDTADVSVKALPPDQLEPGWDYYGLLGQNPPPKKKQELNIVKSKQRTAAKLAGSEKRTESLCIRFGSQTWP